MRGRFLTLTSAHRGSGGVLVAMSGGVDSAVAALLVKEAGFRVVGLTMKNYCYGDTEAPERSCCSAEAIGDARRECDRLGISHRVADVEELFTREVVDDFLSEYENARTPNPCVRCNSIVRFRTLVAYAQRIGIDYVATGHYARVFEAENGSRYLARPVNRAKDQSYFLSGLHGAGLDRVLFPLGEYEGKSDVRRVADAASMDVAGKKESQEVCFVPDGTLRTFLASRNVPLEPGRIEDRHGALLGHHDGLASYTVGQRRGLGISSSSPSYVVELDKTRNVLVVGDADELVATGLRCRLSWIDPAVASACDVVAQVRYRHGGVGIASLRVSGTTACVRFSEPQRAIAPGQTVVFYRGDLVVGSGVIDAAETD